MRGVLILLCCFVLPVSASAQIVSEFGQFCGGGGPVSAGNFATESSGGLPCVGSATSGAFVNLAGTYTIPTLSVGVEDDDNLLPYDWSLAQNYPNPFNPCTEIHFSLREGCAVRLDIFNILGQQVRTLVDRELAAGPHSIEWNGLDESGRATATGIYLYRLSAGDFVQSKKMMLLK